MHRSLMLMLIALILAPSLVLAEEEKPAADPEEGFIQLFNGTDFSGWTISEKEQNSWKIEDGAIIANGPRSHLYTDRQFKNFHFKAEVMTTPGSNSGIYFHTTFQETDFPQTGHESQVNVTQSDIAKTGGLYNTVRLRSTPVKDNEWYTHEIIVKDMNVLVLINGEIVVDYTEPPGVTRGRKISEGSFALQAHDPGSKAYFRNIRVKPLD